MNAVFHGLDFHQIGTPAPFTFPMFVYPLLVFGVWGFPLDAIGGVKQVECDLRGIAWGAPL